MLHDYLVFRIDSHFSGTLVIIRLLGPAFSGSAIIDYYLIRVELKALAGHIIMVNLATGRLHSAQLGAVIVNRVQPIQDNAALPWSQLQHMGLAGNLDVTGLEIPLHRAFRGIKLMPVHLNCMNLPLGNELPRLLIVCEVIPLKGHGSCLGRIYRMTQILGHLLHVFLQALLLLGQHILTLNTAAVLQEFQCACPRI